MFWTIVLMTMWCIGTIILAAACITGSIAAFDDGESPLIGLLATFAAVAVFAINLTGLFTVAANLGAFSSPVPADGCYRVYHDTGSIPVVAGKVATVVPYDDVNWVPISCGGN